MSYPFGEVNFGNPQTNDFDAFCYLFEHIQGKKPSYYGMHGLKDGETHTDGTYYHSSTSEEFKTELAKNPKEWRYTIDWFGYISDAYIHEHKFLTSVNAAKSPDWYNKSNGIPQKRKEPPRVSLLQELADQAYDDVPSAEQFVGVEMWKKEQLKGVRKLQCRFATDKSVSKISEYRDRMNGSLSTSEFQITMYRLPNGEYLIVGGNHTEPAFQKSRCTEIRVVIFEGDFSMQELRMLGNFLNKRKELDRLYVEFDDAYKDIAPLVENKQVKDIKDPLVTQIIKGYGFRDKQITRCRKYVNDLIEQRGMWPKNKKWKNWESKESKLEREEWCKGNTNDNQFATTASGNSFRRDQIEERYYKDLKAQEKYGNKPKSQMNIGLVYKDIAAKNSYNKDCAEKNIQVHHRTLIENFMKGCGIENPVVRFEDLPLYEDDVS
tara:strand:- start:395 stop:1699 length:1305 start_codon:yes stop_codon:yes gene_type:complete